MNILHYIRGRRKGKEAHRIELEAMRDPFLAEALEGYDTVAGDHTHAIRRLQKQVDESSRYKGRSIMLWTSIAASILVIVGVGWYLVRPQTPEVSILTAAETISADSLTLELSKPLTESAQHSTAQSVSRKKSAVWQEEIVSELSRLPVSPDQSIADLEVVENEVIVEEQLVLADHMPAEKVAVNEFVVQEEKAPAAPVASIPARKNVKASASIQGRVVDEAGEPLPGVNIMSKDKKAGTVTDMDGQFTLNTDNTTVVANYIGYETREIAADTAPVLIAMHEDTRQLEEVVVTGYGKQKIRSLVGSKESKRETKITLPEPVIGKRAYRKYLEKNRVRPVDGECAGIKGKVVIQFDVDAAGRPGNLKVLQSLCDAADREAMRLISAGCDWAKGDVQAEVTVTF